MRQLLAGARVFTGDRMVDGHAVMTEGGRVTAVLPVAEAPVDVRLRRLPADALLVPGFLDVQVNGVGGVLFNDTPTAEAAFAIAATARRTGTTGVLPTLITDEMPKMRAACEAAAQAFARPGAGVLGLHLEGPFLSPDRPGVRKLRRAGTDRTGFGRRDGDGSGRCCRVEQSAADDADLRDFRQAQPERQPRRHPQRW